LPALLAIKLNIICLTIKIYWDMITKKNVNKLQNAVIKENAANLVGAVKLYNALFANGADLKAICKALEIPAEYAVKVAALAKDKKRLVAVCSQMLPKVDDTFVKFALYSKVYKDTNADKEKGVEAKTADWCAENVVYGGEYKAFGFTTAESLETKKSTKWLIKENDEYKATYVAVKIKSYSIRTVAKCVSEYLAHESTQQ
jgi:hypothetical protein